MGWRIHAPTSTRGREWIARVSVARPASDKTEPEVHFGSVLSGEKVVASADFLKDFRDVWTTVAGIEMEAAGTALAVHRSETQPQFLMVKGICDFADEDKADGWQAYAADAAGAFVVQLLAGMAADDNWEGSQPARPSAARLTPEERSQLLQRIGPDWKKLADHFDVSASDRDTFDRGREPKELWDWLNRRKWLMSLPSALLACGRQDIIENYPDLAARLSQEPF
jgi:hypothetical protein